MGTYITYRTFLQSSSDELNGSLSEGSTGSSTYWPNTKQQPYSGRSMERMKNLLIGTTSMHGVESYVDSWTTVLTLTGHMPQICSLLVCCARTLLQVTIIFQAICDNIPETYERRTYKMAF
jgi:hypothetical protein